MPYVQAGYKLSFASGIVRFCMDWMRGLKSWRGADGRMFRYVKGDIHAASEETGTPVLRITGKDLSEVATRGSLLSSKG